MTKSIVNLQKITLCVSWSLPIAQQVTVTLFIEKPQKQKTKIHAINAALDVRPSVHESEQR